MVASDKEEAANCSVDNVLHKIEIENQPPPECLPHRDMDQIPTGSLWYGKSLAIQRHLNSPSEPVTIEEVLDLEAKARAAFIEHPSSHSEVILWHYLQDHEIFGQQKLVESQWALPKALKNPDVYYLDRDSPLEVMDNVWADIQRVLPSLDSLPLTAQLLVEREGRIVKDQSYLLKLFSNGYLLYGASHPGELHTPLVLHPYKDWPALLEAMLTEDSLLYLTVYASRAPSEQHEADYKLIDSRLQAGRNQLPLLKSKLANVQTRDYNQAPLTLLPELMRQRHQLNLLNQELESLPISDRDEWIGEVKSLQLVNEQAIQNDLRTSRLRAFVELPSIDIDDRLLLHVLGDAFGAGSELEGNDALNPLSFRLKLLEAKSEVQPDFPEEQQVIDQLVGKLKGAKEIHRAFAGPVLELQKLLSEKIQQLKPGESFFWPGGWNQHAIYYQVLDHNADTITFRVYNTGEGLEFHPKGILGIQHVNAPFIDLLNVPISQFLDPVFLTAFQELKARAEKDQTNPKDLYVTLLPKLKGQKSLASCKTENVLLSQQSGTCSYRALAQTLNWQIEDRSLLKRLEWEAALKGLVDYAQQHQDRLPNEELTRELLKKSLVSFSILSGELFDSQVILDGELQYAASLVNTIEQQLATIDHKVALKLEETAPRIHIIPIPGHQTFNPLHLNPIQELPKKASLTFNEPFILLKNNDHPIRVESLTQDLAQLATEAEKANNAYQPFHVRDAIAHFIQAIPLDDPAFWNRFDPNQAESFIGKLLSLSEAYVRSIINGNNVENRREFQLKPVDFLVQVKILTLADFALHRFNATLKTDIPSLYINYFDPILYGGSPYFISMIPPGILNLCPCATTGKTRAIKQPRSPFSALKPFRLR